MKRIIFSQDALKSLRRHANMAPRLKRAIADLAGGTNAHANQIKALKGSTALRLRVGDFRIIFTETDEVLTIEDIGPRSGIYE